MIIIDSCSATENWQKPVQEEGRGKRVAKTRKLQDRNGCCATEENVGAWLTTYHSQPCGLVFLPCSPFFGVPRVPIWNVFSADYLENLRGINFVQTVVIFQINPITIVQNPGSHDGFELPLDGECSASCVTRKVIHEKIKM